jgi:hypothetical protein
VTKYLKGEISVKNLLGKLVGWFKEIYRRLATKTPQYPPYREVITSLCECSGITIETLISNMNDSIESDEQMAADLSKKSKEFVRIAEEKYQEAKRAAKEIANEAEKDRDRANKNKSIYSLLLAENSNISK